jgi:Domain of unknown function (DUF4157)
MSERVRLARKKETANEVPPIVQEVLSSTGQLLDSDTRDFMESRFGHDFSQVRVHTDERAVESTQAVNARAYTVGQDVVFGQGEYAPETMEGEKLLAHELTHVVQQAGLSTMLCTSLIVDPTDSSMEHEASSVGNIIERDEAFGVWQHEYKISESGKSMTYVVQQEGQSDLNLMQSHRCIQRQTASTGVPLSSPWDDLPITAQEVIDKTYFNTLKPEEQSAFRAVYSALVAEGLRKEVVHVVKVYKGKVRGIEAITKSSLIDQLLSNPRFLS